MSPGCVGLRSPAGEKLCRVYKAICGWKAYPGWGCQGLVTEQTFHWLSSTLYPHPYTRPSRHPPVFVSPGSYTCYSLGRWQLPGRKCKLFTGAELRFTNTTGSGLMEWRASMEWVSLFLQCGVKKQMQQRQKQIKSLNLATICLCTSGCLSDKQFLNQ